MALKLRPGPLLCQRTDPPFERAVAYGSQTGSQIGLTRHRRRENMRGAFVVSDPTRILNRDIVLIDDIYSTGTTASECARVSPGVGGDSGSNLEAENFRCHQAAGEYLGAGSEDRQRVAA